MDPERRKAHLPYHEQLMDSIQKLESLVDQHSFEEALAATAVERTTTLTTSSKTYIYLEREDMPKDMMERFVFGRSFYVHVDEAQLVEAWTEEEKDWTLTSTFHVTNDPTHDPVGQLFRFTSTPQAVVCQTTNLHGDTVQARLEPISGQRFFTDMLISAMVNEAVDEETRAAYNRVLRSPDRVEPLSTDYIIRAFQGLGERLGLYKQSTLSYLPHPEQGDRAVVAQLDESSGPKINSRTLDFYMNTQLLNKVPETDEEDRATRHTAVTAMEIESIYHSSLGPLDSTVRQYASRFPTRFTMDDFRFAVRMNLFEESNAQLFGAARHREQYGLVATTILTTIRPYLQQYAVHERPFSPQRMHKYGETLLGIHTKEPEE